MKTSLSRYLSAIGMAAVFFIAGCSWLMSYGRLTPAYGPFEKVTIQELQKSWRDYTVYYAALHAGVSTDHPSAVMFDPKNDDKTLTVSRWAKVEDEKSLVEMIDTIQNTYTSSGYYPRLWRLVGPDNELYGYVFTSWDHVQARVVEPGTMLVYDVPVPPYLAQDGDERKESSPAN